MSRRERHKRETSSHESQVTGSRKSSSLINKQMIGIAAIFFVIGFLASYAVPAPMRTVTAGSAFNTDINKVGEAGVEFLNNYFVDGGGVILKSVEEDGDLLSLTTEYNGNQIPVQMTRDGEYIILGGVGAINIAEYEDQNDAAANTPDPSPSQPSNEARSSVTADDDPSIGPADAPVEIIEFSDFQCPYCARAEPTVKQVIEEYGDQVRLVYRDFPLSIHSNAQKAAEAGECAYDQGMFWEMHDKMFENQGSLGTASLKGYAEELGMDTAEFNDCLDSGKHEDEVKEDFADGVDAGVTGTPAFFINGIKLSGAQPFSSFKQVIDQELA